MAEATMSSSASGSVGGSSNAWTMSPTETMRDLAGKVRYSVGVNIAGVSHADSMKQPQPAGNCMNWALGHLLAVYSKVLPMFGEQPVMGLDRLARYDRGSLPMVDAAEAIPFEELVAAWTPTCDRVDAGLARVPAAMLSQHVADSPTQNPNETVHTLLFTVMFHQAYHSGQLGVLRRMAGKEGAIK